MPRPFRFVIALSVSVLFLAALFAVATGGRSPAAVAQGTSSYNTLRVYGRDHVGAGDPSARDPILDRYTEDPPYTQPEPIFNPQLWQAPEKDSVTWNPAFMSEFETFDENQAGGLYNKIFAGARNATEKVWYRMWYEPWHWDKDLNASGALEIDPCTQAPYPERQLDEWYPAVMQEFTYMLLEAKQVSSKPEPLAGPVGQTSFVFPVGMRKSDLFAPDGQVDTASDNARYGYGLTSFDADFDGAPDIVHVESERTLFALTAIAADLNGSGTLDTLDLDAIELNGNELAALRLDTKALAVGQAVQFLDHMVIVREVLDNSALLEIWYTGDLVPQRLGSITIYRGDMALSGRSGPAQRIRAVANGGTGTNLCNFPTGPWFVYLDNIDVAQHKARLMVGRALGRTWTGMEDGASGHDLAPGDPWFVKRFYVDGHEYNVVAIKTENGAVVPFPPIPLAPPPMPACPGTTLDRNGNGVIDPDLWPPAPDPTLFKFITIRTPLPKWGEYDDPLPGYLIEQHSVRLQVYAPFDYLSVMPPYNYEHYIIMDVQAIVTFTCTEDDVLYFGRLVGPVPPILQKNGPFPYYGVGPHSPYSNLREMTLFYVEEAKNPQFLGELKEKYGECQPPTPTPFPVRECWYIEQFHTLPWEYTEFILPDLSPIYTGNEPDLYLLTSSFQAPEMEAVLWTQDVITSTTWSRDMRWDYAAQCWVRDITVDNMPEGWKPRVKFWFDPGVGGKKYKDDSGIRIYGFENEGAGDETVEDHPMPDVPPGHAMPTGYPVEVPPYTDPWAPFNPQLPQAPRKDSLTFNPAYLDKFYNGGEPLVELYQQISIREHDAREKVFMRVWYEPEYLDKKISITPTQEYTFPAVMQEFTYMFLNTADQPTPAPPGTSAFAFPMATMADQLPAPVNGELPASRLPSFGYGLTSFDANFDGHPEIVHIHSEATLNALTAIGADFNGNGIAIDALDPPPIEPLSGDEMVIFTLEDMVLHKGDSVQFLDHMVTLDDVSSGTLGRASLQFWYTGGGLHPVAGGQYSLQPDKISSPQTLAAGEMEIVNHSALRRIPALGNNLGSRDGAWFAYVNAVNATDQTVSLIIGRALGNTFTAMDDGAGGHDLLTHDPWYMKRFFVDGHEYNVVAVHIVPNPTTGAPEFKYITIRTPVPKVNFINYEDSQKLEGYYKGPVLGQDTNVISVLPPFNYEHTVVEDIQALTETAVFSPTLKDPDCRGNLIKNVPPTEIRIVDEAKEPQFFGELKEKYSDDECWSARDVTVTTLSGITYAFMADGESGLRIINLGVFPLPVPAELPGVDTPGSAMGVALARVAAPPAPGAAPIPGQLCAFVADGGAGLRIINVNLLPGGPFFEVGFIDTPGFAMDVEVVAGWGGTYAFVADGAAGVRIYNVGVGSAPVLASVLPTRGWARGVKVVPIPPNVWAFVADGTAGLQIFNVTALPPLPPPGGPAPVPAFVLPTLGVAQSVAVRQVGVGIIHAFVAQAPAWNGSTWAGGGLTVFNVTGIPFLVAYFPTLGWAYDVSFVEAPGPTTYVVVADGWNGLSLFTDSLLGVVAPALGSPFATPGWARGVATANLPPGAFPIFTPYAFVADGPAGLRVVSLVPLADVVSYDSGPDGEQPCPPLERWQTEQFHVVPDQYTELRLPPGQKYLLTSNWQSAQSRVGYLACCVPTIIDPACQPALHMPNTVLACTGQTFFQANEEERLRVKFLYQPGDADLSEDIYVNTYPSASGTITGVVKLQGRTNHSGVAVSAGPASATTDSAGRFTLAGVPVGSHTVMASKSGYLYSERAGVVVNAGLTTALPEVRLLGGDADNDCNIDLFDLVAVSSLYGGTPPADSGVDVNGNSVVDIFDLVMVGLNFDKSCPGLWASSPARVSSSQSPAAYLQVAPAHVRVDVGQEFTVTMQLQGVTNLYGVDARLAFNPSVVEVVDANPGAEGVQIRKGSFPNPSNGEVPKQVADNEHGLVWYAISLMNPAPGATGDGTLCSIRFRAKANGYAGLRFAEGTLVDTGVERTPVLLLEGSVRVGAEHLILLPILKTPGER